MSWFDPIDFTSCYWAKIEELVKYKNNYGEKIFILYFSLFVVLPFLLKLIFILSKEHWEISKIDANNWLLIHSAQHWDNIYPLDDSFSPWRTNNLTIQFRLYLGLDWKIRNCDRSAQINIDAVLFPNGQSSQHL